MVAAVPSCPQSTTLEQHEVDCVYELILIVYLALAIVFEAVWHLNAHRAERAYYYGQYIDQARIEEQFCRRRDAKGNVRHLRLMRELFSRAGGEFMTLGFLAFLSFVFAQCGGYKSVADGFYGCDPDNLRFPMTYHDWELFAEIVHVQLSIGMFCYFGLIYRTIEGAQTKIQSWERTHMRWLQGMTNQCNTARFSGADQELNVYNLWRHYFIVKIIGWSSKRPATFRQVLSALDVKFDPLVEEFSVDLLETTKMELSQRFALSAYLAYNLEMCLKDSVEVHVHTWFCLLILIGFFALLHWAGKVTLLSIMFGVVAAAVCVLLAMALLVRSRKRTIENKSLKAAVTVAPSGPINDVIEVVNQAKDGIIDFAVRTTDSRFYIDIWCLRVLQIVLFFVCNGFARVATNADGWRNDPEKTALLTCLFAILYIALAILLPKYVPMFLALLSLPPFIDPDSIKQLLETLADRDVEAVLNADGVMLRSQTTGFREGLGGNRKRSLAQPAAAAWERQTSGCEDYEVPSGLASELADLQRRVQRLEARSQRTPTRTADQQIQVIDTEYPSDYINPSPTAGEAREYWKTSPRRDRQVQAIDAISPQGELPSIIVSEAPSLLRTRKGRDPPMQVVDVEHPSEEIAALHTPSEPSPLNGYGFYWSH